MHKFFKKRFYMNIFQIRHQLFLLIINVLMAAAIKIDEWPAVGNSADEIENNGNDNNGIVQNSHHLPIGPVVLVTGGAAGIGYNLVKELINDPSVLVIIAADINETPLIKEMEEMYSIDKAKAEKGRKIVMYLSLDVANEKSIQNGFNLVKEKLQEYAEELEMKDLKLSTLINNAGIMQTAQNEPGVEALTPKKDVYMKHLEINSVGPALIIGAFRKIMPEDMSARMVFISSTVGSMNKFQGIRSHRNTAYGMSKAAMNLYMLSIAHQQKWLAISICPGWVDTDIGNQVVTKGGPTPTKGNDAAKGIIKMIEGMNKENNGKFYSLHFNDFIPF